MDNQSDADDISLWQDEDGVWHAESALKSRIVSKGASAEEAIDNLQTALSLYNNLASLEGRSDDVDVSRNDETYRRRIFGGADNLFAKEVRALVKEATREVVTSLSSHHTDIVLSADERGHLRRTERTVESDDEVSVHPLTMIEFMSVRVFKALIKESIYEVLVAYKDRLSD